MSPALLSAPPRMGEMVEGVLASWYTLPMQGFTDLETAILAAMCDSNADVGDRLRSVLETAHVTGRENTGLGFFTQFQIDTAPLPPSFGADGIDSPVAYMGGLGSGVIMGFRLGLKDGVPYELEGYMFGDDIDLKAHDLFNLSFTRLEPLPKFA